MGVGDVASYDSLSRTRSGTLPYTASASGPAFAPSPLRCPRIFLPDGTRGRVGLLPPFRRVATVTAHCRLSGRVLHSSRKRCLVPFRARSGSRAARRRGKSRLEAPPRSGPRTFCGSLGDWLSRHWFCGLHDIVCAPPLRL